MTRYRPPHCATCLCAEDERGKVDTAAPFYDLVLLVDRITYDEARRRNDATAATTRTIAHVNRSPFAEVSP